ncbi:MAG: alpha/beta hydrolase family protein [Candidatus Bathyarchaeia archaeon]
MSEKGKYFTCVDYFKKRFDSMPKKLAFKAETRNEWQIWRKNLVNKLKELTGYDTMKTCPLQPKVTERVEKEDFLRERVEIQTEPGIITPFYVLVPKMSSCKRLPVVIAAHGHHSGGKITVAGCVEVPGVAERIRNFNYDYGVQFVKEGFMVFCPDARGFGERRESTAQSDDNPFTSSCEQLNHMANPLGQTVIGMWTWDISRIIDYIEEREDCDPERVGCAGLSGGGMQTLWAAALDDRISCAVVSGYFFDYRYLIKASLGNCSCNFVPHLYKYANMGDIAALIAPRPLLFERGTKDELSDGVEGEQYEIVKKAYKLLGAENRLEKDIFEGGHMWHGVKAISWMKRWLKMG